MPVQQDEIILEEDQFIESGDSSKNQSDLRTDNSPSRPRIDKRI